MNYAKADADAVQTTLKSAAEGLFKDVVLHEIRNDQATKDNIIQALTTIQQKPWNRMYWWCIMQAMV